MSKEDSIMGLVIFVTLGSGWCIVTGSLLISLAVCAVKKAYNFFEGLSGW